MTKWLNVAILALLIFDIDSIHALVPENGHHMVYWCWTKWFNRDHPSGTGDWEVLYWLRKENPGQICPRPTHIEARTMTGLSPAEAGDRIYRYDTRTGFACRNKDQCRKWCNDYRVRFRCPRPYCLWYTSRSGTVPTKKTLAIKQ